jgi:hypothetical protein
MHGLIVLPFSVKAHNTHTYTQEAKQNGGLFRFKAEGEVGPYSEVSHTITFAPLSVGAFRLPRAVVFQGYTGAHGAGMAWA